MENPFLHYVDDFEIEAEAFLEKYECADAIENPHRIPILDIATRLMSLDVIQTECLSPDESVQGAIAFSKGVIDVYDWKTKEYMGYQVESPSIFVDSDIINAGRFNNTLAHECYHWWRHRNYFNFKRTHEQSTEFGIRCDKRMRKNVEKGQWTDVERMEWQARTIAPKILMPRIATKKKIESLYDELTHDTGLTREATTEVLIAKLAGFFDVSRQSAAIRMVELGYDEAAPFTSPDQSENATRTAKDRKASKATQHRQPVTVKKAFDLYCENEFLRAAIDTGAFCFVDGYFSIRDERYIRKTENEELHLTEYAKNHLPECTLDFSVKLIGEDYLIHDASAHLMYRSDTVFKKQTTFDANTQNTELFNKAKDFENKFKRSKETHKTAPELLWEYMRASHWNTTTFIDRTGLDAMNYSRVQKPDHKFTMMPLVSMGVGLGLYLDEMEEVLSLAGLSFKPTDRTDQAYKYLFTGMHGKSIEECNDFLREIGVPELGSQQRK